MEKNQTFEQKLISILEAPLRNKGFEIVLVRFARQGKLTLELLIERIDREPITVSDCQEASYMASAILDVEDIIKENYNLEVSSPGSDRPLVKPEDFIRFKDRWVVVNTKTSIQETRKFKGKNLGIDNNTIYLELPNGEKVEINYSNILKAKLFLSEAEFRKILRDKKKQSKK